MEKNCTRYAVLVIDDAGAGAGACAAERLPRSLMESRQKRGME
jgi:hypothetical protein